LLADDNGNTPMRHIPIRHIPSATAQQTPQISGLTTGLKQPTKKTAWQKITFRFACFVINRYICDT
jgi:hypothetical protein